MRSTQSVLREHTHCVRLSSLRAFRSATGTIALILILRYMSFGLAGLVLPLYFDAIGRSAGDWGLASGAFAFTLTFAEPVWGWASDRVGTAVTFLAAGVGSAVLVPLFALTGHPWLLLAIQLARGCVEFANSPAARKALAHSMGPGRKAVGIGLFQGCASAGSALGPVLGGFLIERWGFAAAFAGAAAISLAAVAVTLANRARIDAAGRPAGAAMPVAAPGQAAKRGSLLPFVALALMAACLFSAQTVGRNFVPILGTSIRRLPATQVALVLGAAGAVSGPLTIAMGRLADLWGRKPLMISGLLCVSAALLGYAYLPGIVGLAGSTLLLYLGTAAGIPAGVALVSDVTPYESQGRMIGLYGACENVGIMAGPLLCGFLWDAAGYRFAFIACALLSALGVAAARGVREKA